MQWSAHSTWPADLPLPTPVNVQALESFLQGCDPQLKKIIVEGFDIGHDSAVTNTMPPNSESINRSQKDAAKKLLKEI